MRRKLGDQLKTFGKQLERKVRDARDAVVKDLADRAAAEGKAREEDSHQLEHRASAAVAAPPQPITPARDAAAANKPPQPYIAARGTTTSSPIPIYGGPIGAIPKPP